MKPLKFSPLRSHFAYLLVWISLSYCNSSLDKKEESSEHAKSKDEIIIASADESEVAVFGCMPRSAYHVANYAGTGEGGATDGNREQATFNMVQGIAFDFVGNMYIADALNHKIRKINKNGDVSVFAGSGNAGSADGPVATAEFLQPDCIAVDKSGNVYVTDFNNKIRKISTTGIVSTFAGSGLYGDTDGAASIASFKYPENMAFDAQGNLYVTDSQGYKIRKVTPSGAVSTYAGTGAAGAKDGPAKQATFVEPLGIAVDAVGNVFVSDGNHKIRKISKKGFVSTYAGTGKYGFADGPASLAKFYLPGNLAFDANNNLFVADGGNYKVRKISPVGWVTTVAGSGTRGNNNGPGHKATFDGPTGIGISPDGVMFVGDNFNNTVRVIWPGNSKILSFMK